MHQQIISSKYHNKLEKEINKVFHRLGLPMHSNKTGNKEFTNYQRISIIILFHRSKKSLRQFIDDNPIPKKLPFPDLWTWYDQLKQVEDQHENT